MPTALEITPAELLGLALCVMILAYLVVNWRTLTGSRYVPVVYGFLCISGAFLCTNLEEFFLDDMFNLIEHSLMAAGALLVTLGCRRGLDAEKQGGVVKKDGGAS